LVRSMAYGPLLLGTGHRNTAGGVPAADAEFIAQVSPVMIAVFDVYRKQAGSTSSSTALAEQTSSSSPIPTIWHVTCSRAVTEVGELVKGFANYGHPEGRDTDPDSCPNQPATQRPRLLCPAERLSAASAGQLCVVPC
jgi:hypothetical protein